MTGSTCPGALLWEMLAADLSAGEWTSLERHMRMCPRCLESLATGRPGSAQTVPGDDLTTTNDPDYLNTTLGGKMAEPHAQSAPDAADPVALLAPGGAAHLPTVLSPEGRPLEFDAPVAAATRTAPGRRGVYVTGAVVLAVLSLAAAPVRSAAAGLLAQLRVNRVAAVAVGPDSLNAFNQLAANIDDIVTLETVNGVPADKTTVESVQVASVKEAGALLGFAPRELKGLGAPIETRVEPGGEFRLRVDGAKVAAYAGALGLPTDGVPNEVGYVQVTALPGLTTRYAPAASAGLDSLAGRTEITLQQVPSPAVIVPPDWDLQSLGRLYLTALGMSPGEAKALASTIEWGSTLVVPIPAGQAQALDVKVDGVDGVLFEATSRNSGSTMFDAEGAGPKASKQTSPAGAFLVWQKDGMLYAMSGGSSADGLVAIAENLK